MSSIKEVAGSLIRESRKSQGLTQEELGERLGLSKSTINRFESGRNNLTLDTLEKIMVALGKKVTIGAE